tara:strand:+ start:5133 stop:6884 length:1752 start_codon:yes stop_codon:yes gene_type:complete
MCGIVGVSSQKDQVEAAFLSSLDLLAHRGPDAGNLYSCDNKKVLIGHRRLSVLDPKDSANQPMVSECGRFVIAFNGEIYNFKKLAASLHPKFSNARSDTRILLETFVANGIEQTLDKVDGMFAFAIFDKKSKRLYLARDRFGEKPLYYGKLDGDFIFSSELKPIIHLYRKNLSLCTEAICKFLQISYVPAPYTIFNEVKKLLPGHYLIWDTRVNKEIEHKAYWYPELPLKRQNMSRENARDEFEEIFEASVASRCVSDVPLGAFLSGGYDSTAVVVAMRNIGITNINTFTIGFDEGGFNEAPFAKEVADCLGTNHTELYFPKSSMLDLIPEIPQIFDEPFADVSQLPTYLVSKLARSKVTVCLSGDGGDELFCGYSRYTIGNKLWRNISRLPMCSRTVLSEILTDKTLAKINYLNTFLPPKKRVPNLVGRGSKIRGILKSKSNEEFYSKLISNEIQPDVLLSEAFQSSSNIDREKFGTDFVNSMMLSDLRNYLPGDILVKVDRASMANSLEARAPFLSPDLYAFSNKLPFGLMQKSNTGKLIVRDYVHSHIPKNIMDRPKMGFGVPIADWLRGDLRDWVRDTP